MRSSLRLLFAILLASSVALSVSCGGRRRGTGGGGGGGGTDGGGGGGTSCTQVCDNAVVIGTAEPDCMVDRAECDSMCPGYDETLKACIAAATSCEDMIACALGGGCGCDVDSTCSSGCACDLDCDEPLDAGGGGTDAGGGGGYDAGGGGYDAGGGGYDAGGGGGCTDTCAYASDGECDDGGPGSSYSVCELGTDCTDCGPR